MTVTYYERPAQGEVHVVVQFLPAGDQNLVVGVLPGAYFPPRRGNKVTLYQDATTPQLPIFDNIENADGSPYKTTDW